MKLIIKDVDVPINNFIQIRLIPYACHILSSIYDHKQSKRWEQYFLSNYNLNINIFSILHLGLETLQFQEQGDQYIIQLNPNIFIQGLTAKLYDICALVNYGNLDMPPYPIIDKVFDTLCDNVTELYQEYIMEQ